MSSSPSLRVFGKSEKSAARRKREDLYEERNRLGIVRIIILSRGRLEMIDRDSCVLRLFLVKIKFKGTKQMEIR